MGGVVEWFLGGASFLPHAVCLAQRPDLVALHAVSDVLIAAAYFAIPAAIWAFVRMRTDLNADHKRIAILFSAFILWCGLTHVSGLVTLWLPYYGAQGLIKAGTATISLVTAFMVWPLLPKLVNLPSPAQLEAANAKLRAALSELGEVKADLERRVEAQTEEIRVLNARFERAITGSPISVFEQDEDLRFTWVYNPVDPIKPEDLLGRSEDEVLDAATAALSSAPKREALLTGETRRVQMPAQIDGETRWFDLTTAPFVRADGGAGVLSVSVEITPQIRQQEHMRVVMRELSHRTKNLLAMVQAIARRTAGGTVDVKDFLNRFNARLMSLADAHDVLVRGEWRGAPLRSLVESQLGVLLDAPRERVKVSGPEVTLRPEAAHYMGLALHELQTNAAKHGALSGEQGRVEIEWRETADDDGRPRLVFEWRERGGPPAGPPERRGFGRVLLEEVVPGALAGGASLVFAEEGLTWRLILPTGSPEDQATAVTES